MKNKLAEECLKVFKSDLLKYECWRESEIDRCVNTVCSPLVSDVTGLSRPGLGNCNTGFLAKEWPVPSPHHPLCCHHEDLPGALAWAGDLELS